LLLFWSQSNQPPTLVSRSRRWPLIWLVVVLTGLLAGAVAAIIVLAAGGNSATGSQTATNVAHEGAIAQGLDVIPFPGTPDASPNTQITFPALVRSEIRSVTAIGSRSGAHAGRLVALPGGRGAAFLPDRGFAGGERVSVVAHLTSAAAGTASGAPNTTELRFSFTVARNAPAGLRTRTSLAPPTASGNKPTNGPGTQRFHSAPNLRPPVVKVTPDPDNSSGDVFLTAQDAPQSGPMIIDGRGGLVWFDPIQNRHFSATDLSVQRYRGKPVLTWWRGRILSGHGTEGEDVILNTAYQRIATVHAAQGYSSDVHDFQLTSRGTALITAYSAVKTDLTSVGGPSNGTVLDSIVQEIDVRTGRLLWEWHALGHVPLTASEIGNAKRGTPYDFFHINSVQELPDGNLLICARNTWAVYDVSRTTGRVIWTLGGKESSFQMGNGTSFEWQHDARLHQDGVLTLFDDAAGPKEENESRGLALNLDFGSMRASLKRAYTHTPPVLASAEGGMQVLPNGSVFVGWGTEPHFSEYTADGRQIWNGDFSDPAAESYRAYRFPWSAQPAGRPAISVTPGTGAVTAYASWNGATDVARWQLLAGSAPDRLVPVSTAAKAGFETAIRAKSSQRYIAVRALSVSGRVLGTSKLVTR
jgi:hypothetical protein